jgi:hypothetical protein
MIDPFCKAIIGHLGIRKFIETGLYLAETIAEVSTWFSELYPEFGTVLQFEHYGVRGANNPWNSYAIYPKFRSLPTNNIAIHSIEKNSHYIERAKSIFNSNPNIYFHEGSSEVVLKNLIDTNVINLSDLCFFYLDAHWENYWPLRDEIMIIKNLKKSVIVIDDFQIPNHPNFGYDFYNGKPCGIQLLEDLILNTSIEIFFPVRSNRDNRGWVVIFSGYTAHELQFMKSLPFMHLVKN